MKQQITLLHIFLLTTLSASGQWNYNGSYIYYNGGNVGIGTASPSNIQGWSKVLDVGATSCCSKIIATADNATFRGGFYTHSSWYGGGGFVGTESNHNLYFNTNYAPKLVLTTGGYFGVGSLSPTAKLHLNSSVERETLRIYKDGITSNYLSIWQGTGAGAIDPIGTGLLYLGYDQSTNVIVGQAGGNLGVGTTSPYYWSRVHAKSLGANPWAIITEANTNDRMIGLGHDGSSGVIGVSYLGSSGWSPLQFRTQNLARMTIVEDGNVGIGTTTPDSKLTVKGTIHTQEVKVDLNGAVAPDYVFEKDYPLTSLEELKSYIDQNKHLPEIPSAKEMEENGINLKGMNLLLLKKVEELTLHLLEQYQQQKADREINNKRISELQMKLEKLTNKN